MSEAAHSGIDGDTALHTAARHRPLEVVRRLVEVGEDPERKNALGETPQTIAMTHRRRDIVSLLVTKGADADANGEDATVLHAAVDRGDADRVRDLLNSGADVRARTRTGWTPLLNAADRGRVAITQMLCELRTPPAPGRMRRRRRLLRPRHRAPGDARGRTPTSS
ncbi:ankyrin repeat domain-containing protein [Nocardia sp. NPDC004568]|uniref:ankyrin repeat domain-containing protein n=1 Tax=Nocardia sp. NPDC004568 TaxID=3154551 RepID=UPI0033A16924